MNRTTLRGHSSIALALRTVLPAALTCFPAVAQGGPPAPTTTAVSAASDFTGSKAGFEHPQIATFAYDPRWNPWQFQLLSYAQPVGGGTTIVSGSGIAKNGSSLVADSAPAPEGIGVAFLHGNGQASVAHAFPAGTWRLRFLAAQRVQGSTPDDQVIRVTVGGQTVFEAAPGATFTEYATEPFAIPAASTENVVFRGLQGANGDQIALFDRVLLDPVLPWSDPNTWDAGVPDTGDDARIPPHVAVAMDGACVAATVQVNGMLTADPVGGTLTTRWILVMGADGELRIGTEDSPYTGDFEITLIGTNTGEDIMGGGTKFLMAMNGGRVELHGAPKTSWSKLTSLVPAQDGTDLSVTDSTGWQVGDRLLVTYTGWMDHTTAPYTTPRSKTGTITAVDPVAGTLTIDTILDAADHCAAAPTTWPTNPQPGQQTWTLDQRAEIGNLSRNLRIVGDVVGSPGFGGHVMIMGMPDGGHGRARIENIRMFRLGQAGELGRYPMHWHMQVDNGAGQYFRNCAVEESFNRAITIHGTHFATAEDNVCFNQIGHAVFFEDGVEQHNQVHRNLVVFTQRPRAGLEVLITDNERDEPQNRTPAVFWISHPNNHLTGNVAAESVGTGYWIIPHTEPTGTSAKPEWSADFAGIDGTQAPLGTISGNVAHGCKSAFDVNDTLRDHPLAPGSAFLTPTEPRDDFIWTNRSWDPPSQEVIEGLVAWGCPIGIYAGLGSNNSYTERVVFRDCVLADNGAHAQLACAFIVDDSLIVHDSGNGIFGQQSGHGFQQGFAQALYDGPGQMYDCHLVGYDGPGGHSIFFDGVGASVRHTNHLVAGLSYDGGGAPRIDFADWSVATPVSSQVWGVVVRDLDGSLSLGIYPGYSLITYHPWMHVQDASGFSLDQPAYGSNGLFSPFRWAHLQVFHYDGNQFLTVDRLPTTKFTRKPYLGAVQAVFDHNHLPGSQIRQCPVIVAPNGAPVPAFEYVVELNQAPLTGDTVDRVDIQIDDADAGDVTLLEVDFGNISGTTPLVYLDGSTTPLAAGPDPAATSYTVNGTLLNFRVVNPGRTHRVRLQW